MGWVRLMILEGLVISIHTPSFIEDRTVKFSNEGVVMELSLNQVISIFMIVRLYMIIKLFGRFSKFQSNAVVKLW